MTIMLTKDPRIYRSSSMKNMYHYLKKKSNMTKSPTNQEEEGGPSEHIQPTISLVSKKRPNWLKPTLEDVEGHGTTKGTFGERKRPKKYSGYATYITKLIEAKLTTFEEVIHEEKWKKATQEEYQTTMKNGILEIIPRPNDKSMVTSKWIYKIKHVVYGSID